MKSDPYTITPPRLPSEREVKQRQSWLGQRKNDWLDHERTAWAAGGKQISWTEWSGELEFRWMTELPHLDLEWARHLAGQRSTAMH